MFCSKCGGEGHLAGKCTGKKVAAKADRVSEVPKIEKVVSGCPGCAERDLLIAKLRGEVKFDRKVYMREYMRKRRQAK